MSFGGSQGSVRYAVLVTDQATAPLQNINRQFTTFGQQMTTSVTKVNAFNSAINSNSRTFTAQANAIKSTGPPLLSLQNNLKANTTQATGLGTSIKNTATKFAGLATGLSATTAGALQLAAGFRDYNDAQIAVERVTRKLSLANEAVEKTGRKVVDLQKKGQTNTKAYTDAVRDHDQALSMQQIQTQLLGEAQERLFDSQTQFVTSVVPTVLGAFGSIGFAMKELGGTGGIGGLIDKFKGLGTGITGAMAGITSGGGGLNGLTDKLKGAGTAATGLKGNLLGLGVTGAIIGGVTIAALELAKAMNQVVSSISHVQQPVSALEVATDKSGKSLQTFNQTFEETEAMARAGVAPIHVALDAIFGSKMTENILKNAGALDKNGKIIVDFGKKVQTLPPTFNAAATSSNAMVNAIIVLRTQAEKGQITWNQYFDALAKLKIPGKDFTAIMDEVNIRMVKNKDAVTGAIKPTQDLGAAVAATVKPVLTLAQNWELQSHAFEGTTNSINLATKAYLDVHNAIVANNPAIQKNIEQTKLQKQETDATAAALKNLNATYAAPGLLAYNNSLKGATSFITLFGNRTDIAKEAMDKFNQKTSETSTGMTGFEGAIQAGVTQFQTLVDVTMNGVLQAKAYREQLIASVGPSVGFANAAKMTTAQLELNQKAILGDVDSINSLNEAHKKLVEEFKKKIEKGVEAFSVAIGVKDNSDKLFDDIIDNIKKKFRKPIKTALQIRGDVKVELPHFNAALQAASTLPENQADAIVKGIIKTIDEKFKGEKGPFAGLRAILENTVKDTDTVGILNANFMKGDYTASGEVVGEDLATGIPQGVDAPGVGGKIGTDLGTGISKGIKDFFGSGAGLDFGEGGGAGIVIPPQQVTVTADTKPAQAAITEVIKRIDSIANMKPAPQLNTKPANSALSALIKRIDSIDNMKPAPKLNTKPANTSLSALIKRIDSIDNMKPAPKLNTGPANKTLSALINRIDSISNMKPTVTVKVNYDTSGKPAGIKAQHGFHGTLSEDTTILAHRGERVDIGRAGNSSGTTRSIGGGGGPGGCETNIYINVMDETIMRKIQARQGRQRFTFGA